MHPRTPRHIPKHAHAAVVGPVGASFGGTVSLPGSKSLTNRALLVAALAHGTTRLRNALDCDDSLYLMDALRELGVEWTKDEGTGVTGSGGVIEMCGAGGAFPAKSGSFFLGNAGTATRFLTAVLAASNGRYVVDGDERMRERPIQDLVTALGKLGARLDCPTGCPPVTIEPGRFAGGSVDISGAISSQFISAVLMAAGLAEERVSVRVVGDLVSRPYLDLTIQVMRDFGARVLVYDKMADGEPVFEVDARRGYEAPEEYFVEGDASAASYFYAAAAITGTTVRVEGVGRTTQQGDMRCADVLAEMGCRVTKESDAVQVVGAMLRGVDCDCSDMPDVVPTLAVAAVFAKGRTRLRGVPHLRHKESDRIASVASELRKLGVEVRELRDGLEIQGTLGSDDDVLHGGEIDTWGDHRIAMALSVAGLVVPDVVIREPHVVSKSFPGFFQALTSLGAPVSFLLEGDDAEAVGPEGANS